MHHLSPPTLLTLGCLAVLGGACGARRPLPPRHDATYEVGVVAGVGTHRVSDHYALATRPVGPQAWEIRTLWTDSEWEDPAGSVAHDSREPQRGDPWPLVTQHAVASVPAMVHFDGRGVPDRIVDVVHWEVLALAAIDALDIPPMGKASGEALVDPDGLLRDLARTFPGRPDDVWVRAIRIAGADLQRVEQCEREMAEGVVTWRCAGHLTAPDEAGVLLHETNTASTLVIDRHGLRSFEERASGTIVYPHEDGVADEPFATFRLVERQ